MAQQLLYKSRDVWKKFGGVARVFVAVGMPTIKLPTTGGNGNVFQN